MSGALIVFAKVPMAGRVKTRLSPALTPDEAAAFYAEMLGDVLDASARAARDLELEAILSVDPPDGLTRFVEFAPPSFRIVAQRGADLSARMAWAAAEADAAGHSPILMRGSDSPMLEPARLEEAVAALRDDVDVAISADRDGGYNLIGLRHAVPGLFDHAMSTATVLDDTLSRAHAKGLRSRLLEPGFDVDHIEDLAWLDEGRRAGRASLCRRTLQFADAHELWSRSGGA